MHNITLIGTVHSENGRCNVNELHKILEHINPEVIFDELPRYAFDVYYSDSLDRYSINSTLLNRPPPVIPLEVKCIRKYKQAHNVKVIPVDIDIREKISKHQEDINFMFHTFFKHDNYVKLHNEKEALMVQEGFHYLNSDQFLGFLEKKESMEKNIMESDIQKNRLLNIYKLFHIEQYDNREKAMLESIYNYSKDSKYHQAAFLIGAEHKKSIMQKINQYNKLSEIKLNWAITNL